MVHQCMQAALSSKEQNGLPQSGFIQAHWLVSPLKNWCSEEKCSSLQHKLNYRLYEVSDRLLRECEDLDSDCAAWAQNGECEKNPGFMVRSFERFKCLMELTAFVPKCQLLHASLFGVRIISWLHRWAIQPSLDTVDCLAMRAQNA